MKPAKLVPDMSGRIFEQEHELEFPSAEQYKGQFISDMEAWESVVSGFPENVQLEIDGLLLRLEESEEIDTGRLRQLATIFRGNSKDAYGFRIARWLEVMADFADFFAEAVDIIIDSGLGLAAGEEVTEEEGSGNAEVGE